jgi:hypothetical protein
MPESAKEIRRALGTLRAEMRAARIRKTSPFNGGMDREAQRWNERRFALECRLEKAINGRAPSTTEEPRCTP